MANINTFSESEKKILLELERILVNHRYNCSCKENISESNAMYMYRIKKALLKSKVEKKRLAVLNLVIESVNTKIAKGMLFKEIFEPLPAIIESTYKNYSKKKKDENKEEIKEEPKEKKESRVGKVCFLSDVVNQILEGLEGMSREELLSYEEEYTEYIKNITYNYGLPRANGEIIGSLNSGMIETTRKNLQKFLYEKCRVRLNSNVKLSEKMSDELLRYRVAALVYTSIMCSKRITKIKSDTNNRIDYKQYNGLKEDVRFLGKVVREKYINEYGLSPKEEIISNCLGGQLTIEGLMEERDHYTRKRD